MGRLDVSFPNRSGDSMYKHRDYPAETPFKILSGPGYSTFQIYDRGHYVDEFTTPGEILVRVIL